MALPQDAVMEIMRIAREAARDHYQGEQRVFEQRYQHDIQGAAREIRELNDRLLAYQRAGVNGGPAAAADDEGGLPAADFRPRPNIQNNPGAQLAGQFANIKIQAPPNFAGSNNPEEFDSFSFQLKMHLGITMPTIVENMERAEGDFDFVFEDYPDDVKEQARSRMALLGSLCTDAAALWVRTQVDGGNRFDGFKLWSEQKRRSTLIQQQTTVGLLERIMSWPINESNVRTELPKWEAASQRFETRSRTPLTDTLKIGFVRKNLGPAIRNHLRLNVHPSRGLQSSR
jgi:hypothetical protein